MTERDIYERLGRVEQLVRQLVASGDKTSAIKAYRAEGNVDLATAKAVIDSL